MMISNCIALGAGFLLTLVIGHFLIPELRKLKAGQMIREDGPTWHAGKAGTPAMGGLMFISAALICLLFVPQLEKFCKTKEERKLAKAAKLAK